MKKNSVLLLIALIIIIVPLVIFHGDARVGTDNQAITAIEKIKPDYLPWTDHLWEPSPLMETILFAAQGLLGFSFILYFFSYWRKQQKSQQPERS